MNVDKRADKRKTAAAYNRAVYEDLIRRGYDTKQVYRMFHRYYRSLRKAWGMELNVPSFADEMVRLHKKLNDSTIKIRQTRRPATKVNISGLMGQGVPGTAISGMASLEAFSQLKSSIAGIRELADPPKFIPSGPQGLELGNLFGDAVEWMGIKNTAADEVMRRSSVAARRASDVFSAAKMKFDKQSGKFVPTDLHP